MYLEKPKNKGLIHLKKPDSIPGETREHRFNILGKTRRTYFLGSIYLEIPENICSIFLEKGNAGSMHLEKPENMGSMYLEKLENIGSIHLEKPENIGSMNLDKPEKIGSKYLKKPENIGSMYTWRNQRT